MSYIWGMKKPLMTLLVDARHLHYKYDKGSILVKSVFIYLR
jgi:hypothetical protein